jgi:hypothetical protein
MIYTSGGKLSTFIFLEEDLTLLPYYPHRTNQGSICFILFTFITFTSFLLNIGDNVQPKCKGRVNDDTLENTIALEFVCSIVGM